MVSYKDITKITYFYENKQFDKMLDYVFVLCNSNNILDILSFIRKERFLEDISNIKINVDNKEVIILKENFLLDIPTSSPTSILIDEFEYILDYPNIINHKFSPIYCIKKIKYREETYNLDSHKDYNIIPAKTYNNLKKSIEEYIENLRNIFIYKVSYIESRFYPNIQSIYNVIYLAFIDSYKNLIQEQLFLMKEYNFTYTSFEDLSPSEIKHYLKAGIKLINERNN